MRLHRFYIDDKSINTTPKGTDNLRFVIDSPELVHQILNVFRLKVGDHLVVFNGTGFDYECGIDKISRKSTIVSNSVINLVVLESRRNNFLNVRKLFLGASLVKKDNFEWIVEKATELGVTDIIPIASERSEKKALNEERLNKIAIEASEQSGRDTTPMVHQIMGPGDAITFIKRLDPSIELLVFHTCSCIGETYTGSIDQNNDENTCFHMYRSDLCSVYRLNLDKETPLAVFIGPEGGWSPTELEMFHKENIRLICLGPQILRAETAVVAALSMVVFG